MVPEWWTRCAGVVDTAVSGAFLARLGGFAMGVGR